ncbi:hypothetical protein [Corynebacterium guangdongense]|uniref:Uncharacterized protein n=1 Tax=Corynebacterium guangdongense TaxID=1783348 RepID=A0ABU1ZVZ8_9CORY|nr:hypothetical protein [Corynebacterium guangdongense]MDR7329086.1 hypothetical protein [Corynebacterium guangdongense]WJZ17655.1 hypothetical protein CGUA_05355 [Corynebacterium guangdongense]
MRSLYQDIELDEAQVGIVREYLRTVNFHFAGGTPEEFKINRTARYLGYMFQKEDLEAFGVGLKSTTPGLEGYNTFVRMSREQLLGRDNPKVLPVNEPVLASSAMTMQRFWESPAGPATHGVDAYATDEGLPGGDVDLDMLEATLRDCLDFRGGRPVHLAQEILDLKVNWGTLLAGRYPRLKHFERQGRLSASQAARLVAFEEDVRVHSAVLESLELPTLAALDTAPVVNG